MTYQASETVIVGGGQAGLSVSYWLKQQGREHIILEKAARPGLAWRQRWDSFTLVTPNWMFRLPGAEYADAEPDGFMPRAQVVAAFERYVTEYALPVAFGVDVSAVEPLTSRPGPDLHDGLARIDQFEAQLLGMIDGLINRSGLDAPGETRPAQRDGFDQPQVAELDVAAAGIGTVIWAAGYGFDFSLVKAPVTDDAGFPVQQRGVAGLPGLYFVGMPWLHTQKSGLLAGVGEDAAFIAAHIAQRAVSAAGF